MEKYKTPLETSGEDAKYLVVSIHVSVPNTSPIASQGVRYNHHTVCKFHSNYTRTRDIGFKSMIFRHDGDRREIQFVEHTQMMWIT